MGFFDKFLNKKDKKSINKEDASSQENLDDKALAFMFNMIYVGYSNKGKIDNNALAIIFECLEQIFNIEDPYDYFKICYEQFSQEYIKKEKKNHKNYLKKLSSSDLEDMFYYLFRLALSDRKLLNLEFNSIQNIAALVNYSKDEFILMLSKNIEHLYLYEQTEDYYHYLSYVDIFHAGVDKFDNEEFEDAIELYDRFLLSINRNNLLFGSLLEDRVYIEGYEDDAIVLCIEDVYFNRGQCYSNLGQDAKALVDFKKALEINPDSTEPLIYHHTGCLMFKLGDHTNCIDYFDKAIELGGENSVDSYYMRAGAYLSDDCKNQNKNKAIQDLKKYLEYNPDDKSALNILSAITNAE